MTIRKFKLFLSLLLLTFSFGNVNAEPSSWRKTGTDGTKPLGSFDYINLFNGHLNFTLPLLEIKGRGKTGVTLPLSIGNQTWQTVSYSQPTYNHIASDPVPVQYCNVHYSYVTATYGEQSSYSREPVTDCYTGTGYTGYSRAIFMGMRYWNFLVNHDYKLTNPGYGPGILYSTYDTYRTTLPGNIGNNTNIADAGIGLLKINFVMPDGSGQSFVDTESMGKFKNFSIVNGQFVDQTRGRNFTSVDGSSTTFISDTSLTDGATNSPYYENVGFSSQQITYLTGYIITKDGSRYRVENGLVRSIRDSNGNQTSFTYDETQTSSPSFRKLTKVTDSLGREVSIQYDVNDSAVSPSGTAYGLRDEISFKSINGSDKKIIVSKTDLGSALREGLTLKAVKDLWTGEPSNNGIFTKQVISKVWMPDGKAYNLQYDSFGELAKVTLPTGAASEYDYDYGPVLTRRVKEKRSYLNSNDSNSLINKTTFSSIYQPNDGTTLAATQPVQVDVKGANDSLLSRTLHYFKGDPANVLNQNEFTRSHGIETTLNGKELKTEILNPLTQEVYQRTEFNWQMRVPTQEPLCSRGQWCNHTLAEYTPGRDPLLIETKTTLEPNNNGGLVKKTTAINPSTGIVAFDQHNNQTDVWDYNYGVGNAPPLPARHQHIDYLTVNPANGINYAEPTTGQDYALTDPHTRGLPTAEKMYSVNPANGSETLISQNETKYDEPNYQILSYGVSALAGWSDPNTNARGNPTTGRVLNITNSSWLETHAQYDQFGNPRKAWDASGDASRFVETQYDAQYQYGFPTKVITPAPDPNNTGHGSNQTSQATMTYDFYTGLQTSGTDTNGQTSTLEYNDPQQRPTATIAPNGARTETIYNDAPGDLWIKVRKQIDATNWDEVTTFMDGLGRAVKTQSKDSQGDVFTEMEYDSLGRVKQATSPYRTGEQKYWTKTRYDELGRSVEAFAPALAADLPNAQSAGTTAYSISTVPGFVGTVVTGTDATGKTGRSITNALGQLIRVDEAVGNNVLGTIDNPAQPTVYKYDSLGKTVKVEQGGQSRYFKYDALGRLLRVRQPEQETNASLYITDDFNTTGQWSAGFTYDNVGNMVTATDAKGVTIINTCDNLNRVVQKTYSGEPAGQTTPTVNYYYDGIYYDAANTKLQATGSAKGALTQVRSSVSTSQTTAFDTFGRAKIYQQITDGGTYTSRYDEYNLSGALIQQAYPSGRTVKNSLESDGDLAQVQSRSTATASFKTYVSDFSYTAAGGVSQLKLGNGRWETAKFNSRQQIEELGLGTGTTDASLWKVNYEYGQLNIDGINVDTTKDSGNIAKQTINFQGLAQPFVQAYRYDSLNRLTEARETIGAGGQENWIQQHKFDRHGNRERNGSYQKMGSSVLTQNSETFPMIDPATNRFSVNQGYTYDKNGNLTIDADDRQFYFNGDNKQTEVRDANGATVGQYFYDGEGKRVKKYLPASGETTIFVYSGGKLIAEYSTAAPPTNKTTNYTTTDQLGTPRVITDAGGNVTSRRDFMPFGEDLYPDTVYRKSSDKYGVADSVRQRFTGYEKDAETGLDFAEARYYNNSHGRFTAVDPLLSSGKSANPQTFNRYSYTSNNPVSRRDKNGLEWWDVINSNTKTRSIYWSTERPTAGDGETVNQWTNHLYKASDGNWYALNPNAGESEKFAERERAYWQYGIYTDFGGSFGGFLHGITGTRDLAYLVAYMKTGNINGALASFGTIGAVNGVGGGVGKFFAPAIERGVAKFFGAVSSQFGGRFFTAAADEAPTFLQNAVSPLKGGLTNAGRAVTKHPEYFGFESTEALQQVYRTPQALNELASQRLQNILNNGVRTTGAGGRYPDGWVTYTLRNGNAASWTTDGTFIGFRGIR